MVITVDTKKFLRFVGRHREAVGVACIAAGITYSQRKTLNNMTSFINNNGLAEAYLRSIGK